MGILIEEALHLPSEPLRPTIGEGALVAATAELTGDVRLGRGVSVWPQTVLRGDLEPVIVGAGSNLQDQVLCHVANGFACVVGEDCTVGHRAILHGCTIGDRCLIGIGAIVLTGAIVGEESIVAAGAVVTEGAVIPPRSMVMGVPGKVRREVSEEQAAQGRITAAKYRALAAAHRAGMFLSPTGAPVWRAGEAGGAGGARDGEGAS
jgi:carbonic anhydrase/acetyltransferase-like protein (isoleucine patch superfamily)